MSVKPFVFDDPVRWSGGFVFEKLRGSRSALDRPRSAPDRLSAGTQNGMKVSSRNANRPHGSLKKHHILVDPSRCGPLGVTVREAVIRLRCCWPSGVSGSVKAQSTPGRAPQVGHGTAFACSKGRRGSSRTSILRVIFFFGNPRSVTSVLNSLINPIRGHYHDH